MNEVRPLIYGTCYVDTPEKRAAVILWANVARYLNPDIDILLIDSCSPFNPAHFLPRNLDISIKRLDENVGHLSRGGRDGAVRSICEGMQWAIDNEYTHCVHWECDLLFARPVTPILKRMADSRVGVACGFDRNHQFCEFGISFYDVLYLIQNKFIEKYDWKNSPAADRAENLPERRMENILGDGLWILPMRGLRNDFNQITRDNIRNLNYGLDYLTHVGDNELFNIFMEMNKIPFRIE